MTIDLDTLREMLVRTELMVPYYQRDVDKELSENAAMTAAGLKPLHSDFIVKLHAENLVRYTREANVLAHVIAYHEGRVYVPGEVGA